MTRSNALEVVSDTILSLLVDAEGGDCEAESRSGNDASHRVVIGVILGLLGSLGGLLDLSKEVEHVRVSSLGVPFDLTEQSVCVEVELAGDHAIVNVQEGGVVDVVVGGVEVEQKFGTVIPVAFSCSLDVRLDLEIELLTVFSGAKRVPAALEFTIRGCLLERLIGAVAGDRDRTRHSTEVVIEVHVARVDRAVDCNLGAAHELSKRS